MRTRFFIFWVTIFLVMGVVSLGNTQDELPETIEQKCLMEFENTGICPKNTCRLECFGGIFFEGCSLTCTPRDCVEISAKDCPLDSCQLINGCEEEAVCYYKLESQSPECGELAYAGDLDCCEGFVKRCGIEFFDGSCDMLGKHSIYGVPICVPCGNGICNQFEHRCNCPEDCAPEE